MPSAYKIFQIISAATLIHIVLQIFQCENGFSNSEESDLYSNHDRSSEKFGTRTHGILPRPLHLKAESQVRSSVNNATSISVIFSSLYGYRENRQFQGIYQERWAVYSWDIFGRKLQPQSPPLIIGLVDHHKYCDPWMEENIPNFLCVELECPHNDFDIPTLPCIFAKAAEYANRRTTTLYVNGDIVFPEEMAEIYTACDSRFPQSFNLVGGRRNIEAPEWLSTSDPIDIRKLENYSQTSGVNANEWGMDYFFLPADFLSKPFPPFLVGRWRWDNAMLIKMILGDVPTVDASHAARVIHFGEDVDIQAHWSREGASYNNELVWKEFGQQLRLGRLSNVPYVVEHHKNRTVILQRAQRDASLIINLKRCQTLEMIEYENSDRLSGIHHLCRIIK